MNSIFVIMPMLKNGMWVFTDLARDLVDEPFVAGADDVITAATAAIPDADKGFNLVFSANPFPTAQIKLVMVDRGDDVRGNTYFCEQFGINAWLCPALYKYFDVAPEEIHAEFRPMTGRKNTNKKHIHEKETAHV